MVLKGYLYRQIAEILSVSDSFIAQMVASVRGRGGDGVTIIEIPREQGLLECRATASGNQLVAAEKLLEFDTITTAYSRQIQHEVQIPAELLPVICALQASVARKRKNQTQKKLRSWSKKTRNSCSTQTMAAGNSSRKNECVFPEMSATYCGEMSAVISGVRVIAELVVPIVNERLTANLLWGIRLLQPRVSAASLSSS